MKTLFQRMQKSLPSYLCKYESFSTQSLQNLKNQVIYFGSSLYFNDPYDCALLPKIKELTNSDVEKYKRYLSLNPEVKREFLSKYNNISPDLIRKMFSHEGEALMRIAIADFLEKRGVSCFSEKKDNLLMWSHYGDGGKGFCLEFSTSNDTFQKIREVRYSHKIPEINIVTMLCDEDSDELIDNLYCTKSIDWTYEQEWRAIHNEIGTEYCYPSSVLTGVYFGPDMQDVAIQIIALILAGQNEYVKLWKGSLSKVSFSVEFQQITYTPYLAR